MSRKSNLARAAICCLVAAFLPVHAATYPLPPAGQTVIGELQETPVGPEDTLLDIARRFNVGYREILLANPGVDPWLPGIGREVLVPTRHVLPDAPRKGIVLNLAEMRLYYFPAPRRGEPAQVLTYPVSIGRRDWQTPLGRTQIVDKVAGPAWYPPASIRAEHAADGDPLPVRVPPGPDNPLGEYALRLGLPGYLIHGTNKPFGIGMQVSHGCIRLYPEDIEILFKEVHRGTPVRIVNQPFKTGWSEDLLYLEAHPLMDDTPGDFTALTRTLVAATREQAEHALDWERAQSIARQTRGIPQPVSAAAPALALAGVRADPGLESSTTERRPIASSDSSAVMLRLRLEPRLRPMSHAAQRRRALARLKFDLRTYAPSDDAKTATGVPLRLAVFVRKRRAAVNWSDESRP